MMSGGVLSRPVGLVVGRHSNPGIMPFGIIYCTIFPEFLRGLALKDRTALAADKRGYVRLCTQKLDELCPELLPAFEYSVPEFRCRKPMYLNPGNS